MKKSVSIVFVCILVIGLLTAWIVGAESSNEITPGAIVSVICTPTEVTAIYDQGASNRVHVVCSENFNGISYFAVPFSRANQATTFESIASAAFISTKKLHIYYSTTDLSGGGWGCATSNCRNVKRVWIANT